MPNDVEVTLGNLADLALGAPEIGQIQVALLHTLVKLLLKKLGCPDETITIGGIEGACIKKLLQTARPTVLPFNDDKLDILAKHLERIADLEQRIDGVTEKVECHFEAIRSCNQGDSPQINNSLKQWEQYTNPCEDLCTTCESKNRIACELLKNEDFLQKLMRRVTAPMVSRMFEFEKKIEKLHTELSAFIRRIEAEYKKIELIDICLEEIKAMQKSIEELYVKFLGTMEEVQDMFDTKLDKMHLPALKKYFKDRMNAIEEQLKKMQAKHDCPRAAGIITDNIKCLSCGATNISAEIDVHKTGLLPDWKRQGKQAKTNKVKPCICGVQYARSTEPTLTERMQKLDIQKTRAQIDTQMMRKICKLPDSSINVIMGSNGKLYRKG